MSRFQTISRSSYQTKQPSQQKSRRQIFIASIGKSRNKQIACHIYQDNKKIKFENRSHTLFQILTQILLKSKRQSFHQLIRHASIKRQAQATLFLPEETLNNNTQVLHRYKQKLRTTIIDRYIPMFISKSKQKKQHHKSVNFKKSINFKKTDLLKQNKHLQSTTGRIGKQFAAQKTSKSIQVSKIKKCQKINLVVMDMDFSNIEIKPQKNKSFNKSNILNISYTEISRKDMGKHMKINQQQKSSSKIKYYSNQHPTVRNDSVNYNNNRDKIKITQFNLDDFCGNAEINFNNQTDENSLTKQASTRHDGNSFLKQVKQQKLMISSPFIGKNRMRNSHIINTLTYSCHSSNKFDNIELNV